MNPCIQIERGFTIGYRSHRAIERERAIHLASAQNSIQLAPARHLLLARNGRGKTTLLKTLAGLLPHLKGSFLIRGGVQFVHEDLSFDPELTGRQIFSSFFRNGDLETAMSLAGRLELATSKPYGKLSKGNRQKVVLVLAETHAARGRAQILLLDEPFSGLDFHARQQIDDIWEENRDGIVRLVCVHPDEPTLKADSALLIRDGKIEHLAAHGALDWLKTRESLN